MNNKKSCLPRRSTTKAGSPNAPISASQHVSVSAFLAGSPLPLMVNFDDAEALFEQQKDPFYLAAFMIQCWLGQLIHRAAFQTGEAWRTGSPMSP